MKKILLIVLFTIIISRAMLFLCQLKAQSKNVAELPKAAVLNFKTENINPAFGINMPDALSRELVKLSGNKHLSVIDRKLIKDFLKQYDINNQNCYENLTDCAFDVENKFNADKRIVGYIKNIEEKVKDKKLSKYVHKEMKQEKYIIIVRSVDIKNRMVELDLKESIKDEGQIDSVIKRMAKRIIKFYTKPEAEKAEIKEPVKKSSFNIIFKDISASGSILKTFGNYKNIGDYGYGINIGISYSVYKSNYLAFCLGLYYINTSHKKSIKSDYIIYPLIKFGHCFSLPYGIKLIPYAGGGYIISIVNGDRNGADSFGKYDYSTDYYYNPACSAGLEIDYLIWNNFSLFFNSSYSIFFEKGSNGRFLEMALGFKKSF